MSEVHFELELRVMVRKILEFKEEKHLTYRELAHMVGVDKSYLHKVIHMKTYPSFGVVQKIAEVMQLPFSVLFLPSVVEEQKDYADQVNLCLKEVGWSLDDLQEKTGISKLRLMDLTRGNSQPTSEESGLIAEVLDLPERYNYANLRLSLLRRILNDFGLQDHQIENVLEYVEE